MKKKKLFLLILLAAATACTTGKRTGSKDANGSGITEEFSAEHTSQNSLDWAGVYKGKLPCADCEGIVVEIRLKSDNTYEKAMTYLGKGDTPFRFSGKFEWDETGGKIRIVNDTVDFNEWYQVGENRIIALDGEGNKIVGSIPEEMYNLNKIDMDYMIREKYWKLIELNGKSIASDEGNREAHFILHEEGKRVSGNTGCNNMMGQYELPGDNASRGKISFSPLATTRMACIGIDYEQDYLTVFENCNSYIIQSDTLSLLKGETELLAKFVAVYLR